jgi:hypothetical protein
MLQDPQLKVRDHSVDSGWGMLTETALSANKCGWQRGHQ